MPDARRALSVVSTLYCSAEYIPEFYRRVSAAASAINPDYEIIFVDDGSPDNSLDLAVKLAEQDSRVRVVELSRNFGHHKAIMTGLTYARGEWVFLVDSDLEEPPELVEEFRRVADVGGFDVVYGFQESRKGDWLERFSGAFFYRMFNAVSWYPVPANLITARLMRRDYVKALLRHRDREAFLGGLWAITGFRQKGIPVAKSHRGRSTYTPLKRLALLFNAVTSFSARPLIWLTYIGTGMMLAALVGVGWVVGRKMLGHDIQMGWASLIASMWFVGGIVIFALGIIGLYLSKVFSEVKRRPYTVVRKVHSNGGE
jgi:putative glycosyltransferase